jgi:hypothetical protein
MMDNTNKPVITTEQEANLRKGAAYLLAGQTAMEFDMSTYISTDSEHWDDDDYTEDPIPFNHKCGSIGCALGHFPDAGVEPLKEENWDDYADRVTGLNNLCWMWCFDVVWAQLDNTPQGAAKRILWLLDKGLPINYICQMSGDEPLCYTDYQSV